MDRTMLMDSKLTDIFWTHAVYTMVHIQNRVMLRNNTDKTPYELWKGRPANVKHFRVFGSKCYIKREAVREMPQITKPTNTLCKHCQQGKKRRTKFKSKEYSTTRPLEIMHTLITLSKSAKEK